jgi:hypothetical protein
LAATRERGQGMKKEVMDQTVEHEGPERRLGEILLRSEKRMGTCSQFRDHTPQEGTARKLPPSLRSWHHEEAELSRARRSPRRPQHCISVDGPQRGLRHEAGLGAQYLFHHPPDAFSEVERCLPADRQYLARYWMRGAVRWESAEPAESFYYTSEVVALSTSYRATTR